MKKLFFPVLVAIMMMSNTAFSGNEGDLTVKTPEKTSVPAANCSLQGKVTDLASGETLAGVEISLKGTDQKTFTDLDGNFSFNNLISGDYTVICSLISYNKSLVEDLKVNKHEKEQLTIKLEASR
jgi:hypothetical protein